MECLIKFLNEEYQLKLRKLAQTQSESYEEAIEKYKDLFISNLKFVRDKSNTCACKNDSYQCNQYCKLILESIKDADTKIETFFKEVKNTYLEWIDVNWEGALNRFKRLLTDFNLLQFQVDDITKFVFFKGRKTASILTTWDMFHIPFNRRYLISNQRYSLTGQPIIYLGLSVLDVVEELEIQEQDLSELKISTFQFKENLKIYDLRSKFYEELIHHAVSPLFESIQEDAQWFTDIFFRNLLSSICSFEKRKEHKEYSFCEEYVIPQILAQILKKEGFSGIFYLSTKRFKDINMNEQEKAKLKEIKEGVSGIFYLSTEKFKNINMNEREKAKSKEIMRELLANYKTKYKENMAVFTVLDLSKSNVYDKNLYNKINLSKPVDLTKVEEIKLDDIEQIIQEIEFFNKNKSYKRAYRIVAELKREFKDIRVNDKIYFETDLGKIHLYHIYMVLSNILGDCIKGEEENNE